MTALRLEGLTHTYGGQLLEARTVLNIGNWQVGSGEHILLRGVSGSGKTTLLNIIAGLLTPTTGEVFIADQALYRMAEAQRDRLRAGLIGYVFQMHHLLPALSALENVIMPMAFARSLPRPAWRRRALELLENVGLTEYIHHRPAQLSAGQQVRVAVARALANSPPVLLADEPTAALDAENGARVIDLLQRSTAQRGAILIVASHDPALSGCFERIVDLRAGQLHVVQPAEVVAR